MLGKEIALASFAERERKVRRDFWSKLKRVAGMVPFVEGPARRLLLRARPGNADATARHAARGACLFHPCRSRHSRHGRWLLTAVMGLFASYITPTIGQPRRALGTELPAKS